MTKSPFS